MATEKEEQFLYSIIQDFPYEKWFCEKHYNRKVLNDAERKDYLMLVDRTIAQYSESLQVLKEGLIHDINMHDEFHEIQRTIISVLLFATITMIDDMVVSKYFIMADKDYDKRFMRGKMKVLLNEGFKKLYGFDEKTRQKSEWNKLASILKHFPDKIRLQHEKISSLLQKQADTSTWWREERNMETHLDAEKLYDSRCEELIESEVMMDSMKLFDTFQAVYLFLKNLHGCVYNTLVEKYYRGELI